MAFSWEPIHITYRVIGRMHTFCTADLNVAIAYADRAEAAAQMVIVGRQLSAWNMHVFITAYDRLGPDLKLLRKDLADGAWMTVTYDLGGTPRHRAEVTLKDFVGRLPKLDPGVAAIAFERFAAARLLNYYRPSDPTPEPPTPAYRSWNDYLVRTTRAERLNWCARKARAANEQRLLSDAPVIALTGEDVWNVMLKARGLCAYCGSLAVERKPYDPVLRHRTPWAPIGRRVGTLGHAQARFYGGGNDTENLRWSCLWCNVWPSERRPSALDHGAFYPNESGKAVAVETMMPSISVRRFPINGHQRRIVRDFYIEETPIERHEFGELLSGGQWMREDPIEIRGRRLRKFGAAVRWLQSLPPEDRDGAIQEMQAFVEVENGVDDELLPDHEYPCATVMWREMFGD